ncbi:carbohydrate kinase family protein [Nocardia sp. NPDC088792]|uniref:carbohydrate kinase family protein n=1 Tax=Nocardia sp. NPDC088792 TaxID=3364332 RepID=UPI003829C323
MDTTEIDASVILQLSVVRRYAFLGRTTPEKALREAIRHVARKLTTTDQLIVDAELCLELLRDDPPPGIDLEKLYSGELTDRRRYLTLHWRLLHEILGATEISRPPSLRTVRGGPETRAFTALAVLLISESDPDAAERNTVTIIGDAVMDQILKVDHFPAPGSSMWGESARRPGGKGLNRAVALRELGLDARLLTVVGEDADGQTILDYLKEKRVDTSLIKVKSGTSTPVTTVISPGDGEYASIAAREGRTHLMPWDLDAASNRQAIIDAKAVLLTFEQTDPVIEKVLELLDGLQKSTPPDECPWLIVNVCPSRELTARVLRCLSAIDYLVGSSDELAMLCPDLPRDDVAHALLGMGVGAVCVVEKSRCTVHRQGATQVDVTRYATNLPSVAGAVSAFSSALTYRLVTGDRAADTADFDWATAAMAALTRTAARRPATTSIPEKMPSAQLIEQVTVDHREK